jgi:two-component system LytT family response regulator
MVKGKIYTAFVVDDEPAATAEMLTLLKDHEFIEITGVFNDSDKVIQTLKSTCPDIVFLDVQMPGKDGFTVLKEIRSAKLNPYIVFVTAYNEYAVEAIRQSAFDYLLKPVEPAELANTLNRILQQPRENIADKLDKLIESFDHDHKIKLESSGGFLLVEPKDIFYCLADWNYTEVHLTNGQKEIVSMNIGRVEKLLSNASFFRISRSAIINLAYIVKVNRILRKCVIKNNGQEVSFSIPRSNIPKLEACFKK